MQPDTMKSYTDFYNDFLACPRKRLYCESEDQRRTFVTMAQSLIDSAACDDSNLRLFHRKLQNATSSLRRNFNDVLADHGYDDPVDLMEAVIGRDEDAPTLCEHGCMVEPDGCCPHGHKSVLILMGVM